MNFYDQKSNFSKTKKKIDILKNENMNLIDIVNDFKNKVILLENKNRELKDEVKYWEFKNNNNF